MQAPWAHPQASQSLVRFPYFALTLTVYDQRLTNYFYYSGVFLVLIGALATALQMIVEEIFLKKRNYHPLHVVGMEGLYGTIIMGLVSVNVFNNNFYVRTAS